MAHLDGSVRLMFLYDLCDEIDLDAAAALRGGAAPSRKVGPSHAPRYAGFETPPLPLASSETAMPDGRTVHVQVKAFRSGVLSVALRFAAAPDWPGLVEQVSRLLDDEEVAALARRRAGETADQLGKTLRNRYAEWLTEEFLAVELRRVEHPPQGVISGERLTGLYRDAVTQIVRGERSPLSEAEQRDALEGTISCYPADVLVTGWAAALVYDPGDGREDTLRLIEYANYQLLEYRHYDERLKQILRELYSLTQQKLPFWKRWWRRWRIVREAERLNSMRLEIGDLADRVDDSLRLLGDMFYNRAYRLISERIGLNDYRAIVEEKLKTAGELYEFLVDQVNHRRALILEFMVVVILIIELFNIKPHWPGW